MYYQLLLLSSLLCLGNSYNYSNTSYDSVHHFSISGVGYGTNTSNTRSLRFSTAFDNNFQLFKISDVTDTNFYFLSDIHSNILSTCLRRCYASDNCKGLFYYFIPNNTIYCKGLSYLGVLIGTETYSFSINKVKTHYIKKILNIKRHTKYLYSSHIIDHILNNSLN